MDNLFTVSTPDVPPPPPFDPVPCRHYYGEMAFGGGKCVASWRRLDSWRVLKQDGLNILDSTATN